MTDPVGRPPTDEIFRIKGKTFRICPDDDLTFSFVIWKQVTV